jgi:hypothetical protein
MVHGASSTVTLQPKPSYQPGMHRHHHQKENSTQTSLSERHNKEGTKSTKTKSFICHHPELNQGSPHFSHCLTACLQVRRDYHCAMEADGKSVGDILQPASYHYRLMSLSFDISAFDASGKVGVV